MIQILFFPYMRKNINRKYNSSTRCNVYLCLPTSKIDKTEGNYPINQTYSMYCNAFKLHKKTCQWYITCRLYLSKLLYLQPLERKKKWVHNKDKLSNWLKFLRGNDCYALRLLIGKEQMSITMLYQFIEILIEYSISENIYC